MSLVEYFSCPHGGMRWFRWVEIWALRDQICTKLGPKVSCARQVDFWWKGCTPPCGSKSSRVFNLTWVHVVVYNRIQLNCNGIQLYTMEPDAMRLQGGGRRRGGGWRWRRTWWTALSPSASVYMYIYMYTFNIYTCVCEDIYTCMKIWYEINVYIYI